MFKKLFTFYKTRIARNDNDFHEFKPILSEIEERPMNPLGPAIFWIIISFIVFAALWMYFGKVDVVISAQGVIIPDGEEKLVQSLDKGVVKSIFVKEGEYVIKGQTVAIVAPAEYEPGLELISLKEEEKATTEQLNSAKERLRLAEADEARLREVLDIIPQARYDEVKKEVITLTHDVRRMQSALYEIKNRRQQIEKKEQILKSPIDGYIGQIFVHTEGGVVNPVDKIASVVPKDAKLKIKANVLNKDIGFVKAEMPVSVKLDTYNFQKYGMLDGNVAVVSPNSIEDERLGHIYEVYISLNTNTLFVEGKEEHIKAGMTTLNEIKIGKRRIIEFFIYPLIKYLDESIKVQ